MGGLCRLRGTAKSKWWSLPVRHLHSLSRRPRWTRRPMRCAKYLQSPQQTQKSAANQWELNCQFFCRNYIPHTWSVQTRRRHNKNVLHGFFMIHKFNFMNYLMNMISCLLSCLTCYVILQCKVCWGKVLVTPAIHAAALGMFLFRMKLSVFLIWNNSPMSAATDSEILRWNVRKPAIKSLVLEKEKQAKGGSPIVWARMPCNILVLPNSLWHKSQMSQAHRLWTYGYFSNHIKLTAWPDEDCRMITGYIASQPTNFLQIVLRVCLYVSGAELLSANPH